MTTTIEQGEAGPSTIPLYLVNGVATIWDAQTAATLHCQYDISGLRVGTLPGVSQQNGFLGLPMTLMQEETAHLVNSGICHLVQVPTQPIILPASEIEHQKKLRIERIQNLERIAREEADRNAQAAKEMFAKGGDKAKAKREERARLKAAKAKANDNGKDSMGSENFFTPEPAASTSSSKPEATSTITSNSDTNKSKQTQSSQPGYFHTVPSLPPHLPTPFSSSSSAQTSTSSSSSSSIPNSLFPYPQTAQQIANLKTFSTLSKQQYRMGLGPRFGGEYLIYPGDYLRYHAHFTSQVVRSDEIIRPMEIVAWGRLGTGTKKAGLICCVSEPSERADRPRAGEDGGTAGEERDDEEKGGVEFYSLEWANFG